MATKEISPTGNDSTGTGSEANPWRTVKKLMEQLGAGDNGIMQAGDYTGVYETLDTNAFSPNNGASGNHILIEAEPNGSGGYETVTWKGHILAQDGDFQYYTFKGWTFKDSTGFGIRFYGDRSGGSIRVDLIDMEMTGCAKSALFNTYGANYGILAYTGGSIHGNGISSTPHDGITVTTSGADTRLENVEMYNNGNDSLLSGKGFQQELGGSGYLGYIKNCYIHDHHETGVDWHAVGGEISNCIFDENGLTEDEEDGDNNLSLQAGSDGNLVYGNLFLNAGKHSIMVGGTDDIIYNNTAVHNIKYTTAEPISGYWRAPMFARVGSTGCIIKNNLLANLVTEAWLDEDKELVAMISQKDGTPDAYADNTWDNNLFYSPNHSGGAIAYGFGSYLAKTLAALKTYDGSRNQNSVGGDPLFDSVGINNCIPQTGSPAIDAGVAAVGGGVTIPSYNGSAPDIGYYETAAAGGGVSPSIRELIRIRRQRILHMIRTSGKKARI